MYKIKTEHAFFLSILLCTLPIFQLYVTWTVTVPYLYGAILSFISGIIMFKVVLKQNNDRLIYKATSFLISIVFLVIAMYIYPPAAMIYWVAGIIPLTVLNDEDFTKKWYVPFIIYISTGMIASAAYFLSIKLFHFLLNIGFPSRGGLIDLTKIPLKLKWFSCCPLTYALNLWNIFPTYTIASIVGIIIIGRFLSTIIQVLKKHNGRNILWSHCLRLLLITSIVILSYLPNLAITDTVPVYRTLGPLTMVIFVLFYSGLVKMLDFFRFIPGFSANIKDKIVTASLIILSLISTYHGYNNVNNFAMLQATDYNNVKSVISEYGISKLPNISEIYVRRIDEKEITEKGFLAPDEWGIPTTAHSWGPRNVVKRALRELGVKDSIKVTQGTAYEPMPKGDNILTIDMTKFDYVSNYNSSITKLQRYCLTIPNRL